MRAAGWCDEREQQVGAMGANSRVRWMRTAGTATDADVTAGTNGDLYSPHGGNRLAANPYST